MKGKWRHRPYEEIEKLGESNVPIFAHPESREKCRCANRSKHPFDAVTWEVICLKKRNPVQCEDNKCVSNPFFPLHARKQRINCTIWQNDPIREGGVNPMTNNDIKYITIVSTLPMLSRRRIDDEAIRKWPGFEEISFSKTVSNLFNTIFWLRRI